MASTLSRPPKPKHPLKRVAILFAGGPAPAANAVISTAAVSFLRNGIDVIGIHLASSPRPRARVDDVRALARGRYGGR